MTLDGGRHAPETTQPGGVWARQPPLPAQCRPVPCGATAHAALSHSNEPSPPSPPPPCHPCLQPPSDTPHRRHRQSTK
jgi:hypothetical protein